MSDENINEPIMSITPDGIKINTPPGASVKTNSTQTYMNGVKETSTGGEISHEASDQLVQINNEMTATNEGEIVNEGGSLRQEGNKMLADHKGKIINKSTSKRLKVSLIIVIIGVVADVLSLISSGQHFWGLLRR